MGQRYAQLSLEDRCEISRLQAAGLSLRKIAAAVDRAPSTISRELKRNRGRQVGYKPSYAAEQAKARRWSGSRLMREPDLRRAVLDRLAQGWSPEQIAGRLKLDAGHPVISYESIYRFIYAQIARTKDYRWRLYLPRSKSKRGFRGRRGGSPASFIEGRIPIAERPLAVADRKTPGHWEADLMLFAKYGQAVLAVHERYSRLILATRPPNKAAEPIAEQLLALFATMPPQLRQTVTFDNGTEFARHRRLHALAIADLLLRHLRTLAEGRHRERHRSLAPLPRPQDRSRHPRRATLPQSHRCSTTPLPANALTTKPRPRPSSPTVALRM